MSKQNENEEITQDTLRLLSVIHIALTQGDEQAYSECIKFWDEERCNWIIEAIKEGR